MSERIKNCPFCGGKAEVSGYAYAFYARCLDRNCIASSHGLHYEDADGAIAAWNRRYIPTEAVEAARRVLDAIHPLDVGIEDAHAIARLVLSLSGDVT